jgi:hypothetical protein
MTRFNASNKGLSSPGCWDELATFVAVERPRWTYVTLLQGI